MSKYLYIMRHAKAGWGTSETADSLRTLTDSGIADAAAVGSWLQRQTVLPVKILVSSAVRTRQTAELVCQHGGLAPELIQLQESLYLADLNALLSALGANNDSDQCVMLIGHNPGLEELLIFLADHRDAPLPAENRMFSTANVALLALPEGWQHLHQGRAQLVQMHRPGDL